MLKPLNIGLIGYGFMGRTHSNAYRKVNNFFDLQHRPVLKAVCGRNTDQVKKFAGTWGYESTETDWRKLVGRKEIDAIDICTFAFSTAASIFSPSGPFLANGFSQRLILPI